MDTPSITRLGIVRSRLAGGHWMVWWHEDDDDGVYGLSAWTSRTAAEAALARYSTCAHDGPGAVLAQTLIDQLRDHYRSPASFTARELAQVMVAVDGL